jgi:hypothetical protein
MAWAYLWPEAISKIWISKVSLCFRSVLTGTGWIGFRGQVVAYFHSFFWTDKIELAGRNFLSCCGGCRQHISLLLYGQNPIVFGQLNHSIDLF